MAAGAVITAVIAGCRVGPDYEKPVLQNGGVPDAWHQALVRGINDSDPDLDDWWRRFDDPVMVECIDRAIKHNISLKIAVATLVQARAEYGVASADYWPDLIAGAGYTWSEQSDNTAAARSIPGTKLTPNSDFQVGIDASWEVDLWGRISRGVESAQATVEEELENYRDALITVRAEVASSYINARALQKQYELTNEYIRTLEQTLRLVELQYERGTISRGELEQFRSSYDQAMVQLPEAIIALQAEYNRLAVLLGTSPGDIEQMLAVRQGIPRADPDVAVGVPADLIRRRPDIRAAERALAAQTATIGETEATLYPKLTLSGSFGFEAEDFGRLFNWSSRTFSVGPSVTWDVFNGNRIRSQVQVQQALTRQAFLDWELTVLEAFEEVENAMTNLIESGRILDSIEDATRAQRSYLELAGQQFRQGTINAEDLQDAQRDFLTIRTTLAQEQGSVSQNLVALYKALGGDWQAGPPPPQDDHDQHTRSSNQEDRG